MIKSMFQNRTIWVCASTLLAIMLAGLLAPWIAPNDPNMTDIIETLAPFSAQYPLGTDHLGRCILSRLLFGIRTTLYYSLITMLITAAVGALIGIFSGYVRGKIDALIMRGCDVMLSFPYEVLVLSIVGLLGPGIANIIVANFVAKLAWYVRMLRNSVIRFNHVNFIHYSQAVGTPNRHVLFRHLLPNISAELVVLMTLDLGWVILSISALSFLGLGVQQPTAEWGAMLSEAKEVMFMNPEQMVIPGLAIMIVVACCNMLGDSMRDVLDPKEAK